MAKGELYRYGPCGAVEACADDDALDDRGAIRDGYGVRVPTVFMDSRSEPIAWTDDVFRLAGVRRKPEADRRDDRPAAPVTIDMADGSPTSWGHAVARHNYRQRNWR